MILFFRTPTKSVIATEVSQELPSEDIQKLSWLYGEATVENEENLKGCFIGPRREMITPWSTNAVEITQNMGLTGIQRIEEYFLRAGFVMLAVMFLYHVVWRLIQKAWLWIVG